MIVCVCHGISEKHIKEMVESGAACVKDVQKESKAGSCCGICVSDVKRCFDREYSNSKDRTTCSNTKKKS